jgi:hypothetical protein
MNGQVVKVAQQRLMKFSAKKTKQHVFKWCKSKSAPLLPLKAVGGVSYILTKHLLVSATRPGNKFRLKLALKLNGST